MKRPLRVAALLTLTLVLLLALGVAPAFAATPGTNTGISPLPHQSTQALLVPGQGVPTCRGITAPIYVDRYASVYDFWWDSVGSSPTWFWDGWFSGIYQVCAVGYDWATWNPYIYGKHVAYVTDAVAISFCRPQAWVGVVAEPNVGNWFDVTIEAYDRCGAWIGSFTESIYGWGGASFIGLRSSQLNIASVVVYAEPNAYGFAFSDLTYSQNLWPESHLRRH